MHRIAIITKIPIQKLLVLTFSNFLFVIRITSPLAIKIDAVADEQRSHYPKSAQSHCYFTADWHCLSAHASDCPPAERMWINHAHIPLATPTHYVNHAHAYWFASHIMDLFTVQNRSSMSRPILDSPIDLQVADSRMCWSSKIYHCIHQFQPDFPGYLCMLRPRY